MFHILLFLALFGFGGTNSPNALSFDPPTRVVRPSIPHEAVAPVLHAADSKHSKK
jgi:hypothetical protein